MRVPSFALGMALFGLASVASAGTKGMVADNATGWVTVFDADTGTVFGTVVIPNPNAGTFGDVSITADQTRGFVTDFNSHVWVIDLTATPPVLAAGPNPIAISNGGEDLSISPDRKFLAVCDGVPSVVSVVDIATRTEIATFDLGGDCNSVDVCSDGSVLVTSFATGNVRRLTLDASGSLTDTGEV